MVQRFLLWNNLAIRKISHEGQKFIGIIENLTYKFLIDFINKKKLTQINDNIEWLINIDERKFKKRYYRYKRLKKIWNFIKW